MKNLYSFIVIWIVAANVLIANGVGIVDASNGLYLKLISSVVQVDVENQVAIITTRQSFRNIFNSPKNFKYAFPIPGGASATELRWNINGVWQTAQIAAEPQDTTLPGGGGTIDPALTSYLGSLPLYFEIDDPVQPDSIVQFELTYVQFLKYEFGNVLFNYPNDYSLIQTDQLDLQEFTFNLTSARTIESIASTSHPGSIIFNDGNNAHVYFMQEAASASSDYDIYYTLNLEELGLFSFSTFQPDTLVPDEYGSGFFTFVAEPDPTNVSDIINKVFTLIIDRSGSMSGNKIVQARNAASFIVNNLNEGDKFNIVDFSSYVSSFQPQHVPYNIDNRNSALNYIASLHAGGLTNISGAFSTAIPQFSSANDTTANIIIFFTDGEATSGITNTNGILDHVQNLTSQYENNILIFTFGIGSYVNQQLLTLLALQNNGIAEFLGDNELEEAITRFYLQIKNPVMLNSQISFSSNSISEIYPEPLPNLYKGQQMIVSGRYLTPGNVSLTLTGQAFGQMVQYQYDLTLADSSFPQYQFLPKIWAKQKIEKLMVEYYSYPPDSFQADSLEEYITTISVMYGVITEFTSFTGITTGLEEETDNIDNNIPKDFQLLGNYPNPFNPSTKIKFSVGTDFYDMVKIRIYNSIGQLIRVLTIDVNGSGIYEITWDGLLQSGEIAPSDMYIYTIDFGNTILAGKMMLLK